MHHYSQQVLCMETKPITENSSTKNQHLSMPSVSKNFIYFKFNV